MGLLSGDMLTGSDDFIIGLTDESPAVESPELWNYDVCGQWPGAVGSEATVHLGCDGTGGCQVCQGMTVYLQGRDWKGRLSEATVHLRCADNLPPRRYVILQLETEPLIFCELQVYVRRTYTISVLFGDEGV